MAEISNSAVFTNDVVTSSGTSDLLQQAFQQVVDEDEHENEFVAFLQSDENESQTIHLTPAQAAALGLTFEVNSNDEVTYGQDTVDEMTAVQDNVPASNTISISESSALSSGAVTAIEELNFNEKIEQVDSIQHLSFKQWSAQNSSDGHMQDSKIENDISLDEVSIQDIEQQTDCAQKGLNQQSLLTDSTKMAKVKTDETGLKEVNEGNGQYTGDGNLSQNDQVEVLSSSQAQILQKLPVIFPSQFIIKPAQTILKPAKNIRLFQNSGKVINAVDTSQPIAISSSANSVLLSKSAIFNAVSPQIVKATPITAQLVNTGAIPAQLLNTSQILAGPCHITHQAVSAPHISSTIIGSTAGSAQIRLSPVIKTTHNTRPRGNVQQFITPVLKTATNIVPKSIQVSNNPNIMPTVSTQFLKSVQIQGQIVKATAPNSIAKASVVSNANKANVHSDPPVIFRTASVVKARDLKTAINTSTSVLKSTQACTAPISILKPQTKITFDCTNRQSAIAGTPNTDNYATNSQSLPHKIAGLRQSDSTVCAKSAQSDTSQQKPYATVNGTNLRIHKKPKNILGAQKSMAINTDATDNTKPLGSSENPIQIVQQGHTFHSVQRLTQAQLKQIAHVLQQRSQEAAATNERIVYRVVFPEELDLRIRSPGNLLKTRGGKRGRPKKNAAKTSTVLPPKPLPVVDEELDELKDERKKVVARTRSGRLSRPPRHMVRDYKHLHHLDFSQPDLDDSDGGYSDYNTNSDKLEDEESSKELLAGLEVPKRKISDHFRCPTCNKIYLGRTRMARHFEMHPDHGSPEQLPPPTPPPEIKQAGNQDPLKRKGKKRGPWAYVTPEAKSERRQVKLKEAISVCEDVEIVKIAAKPVLNAQSLFDLLILKSENNARNFLQELKQLLGKVREKVGGMLTLANGETEGNTETVDVNEELLCNALGLSPGRYKVNNYTLKAPPGDLIAGSLDSIEPPLKLQKMDNSEDGKENIEERLSSGFSESSDLSVSDFLNDKRTDSTASPSCPEVLSALTLMRKNPSPVDSAECNNKSNVVSKLLISSPEIQSQISDNPGFQKVDISATKISAFQKIESVKEGLTKLHDKPDSNCARIFDKTGRNYEEKLDPLEDAFIKLEPMEESFVKIDGNEIKRYEKSDTERFEKIQNGLNVGGNGSQGFAKGFQKLVTKVIPANRSDLHGDKADATSKILTSSECKMPDDLPMLQDTVPIISSTCDNNIFVSADGLDIAKMTQYDHISHLDILNAGGTIDKNLLIDEKLVEQLHLVDQSTLVDELVSERLKNIMPDTILENNLIPNNANLDTDLDFEALSEEFNRNTRS